MKNFLKKTRKTDINNTSKGGKVVKDIVNIENHINQNENKPPRRKINKKKMNYY